MNILTDDFEVSIKITVFDLAGNFEGEYQSEILDDKTVHAIIEQVAKGEKKTTIAKEFGIRGVRGEIFVLLPPDNFVLNHPIRLIHPLVKIYIVTRLNGEVIVGET